MQLHPNRWRWSLLIQQKSLQCNLIGLVFYSSIVICLIKRWVIVCIFEMLDRMSELYFSATILVFIKILKFVLCEFVVVKCLLVVSLVLFDEIIKYMLARYVWSLHYVVYKIWLNIFCWILAILIDLSLWNLMSYSWIHGYWSIH
jgi:hypothetical protein